MTDTRDAHGGRCKSKSSVCAVTAHVPVTRGIGCNVQKESPSHESMLKRMSAPSWTAAHSEPEKTASLRAIRYWISQFDLIIISRHRERFRPLPHRRTVKTTSSFEMRLSDLLRSTALAGLLLFCLLATADAQAQTGRIVGTVTDAQTGDPLPGANIVLQGTSRGTARSEEGQYTLDRK